MLYSNGITILDKILARQQTTEARTWTIHIYHRLAKHLHEVGFKMYAKNHIFQIPSTRNTHKIQPGFKIIKLEINLCAQNSVLLLKPCSKIIDLLWLQLDCLKFYASRCSTKISLACTKRNIIGVLGMEIKLEARPSQPRLVNFKKALMKGSHLWLNL